jgi:hypothetical protein
MPPFRYTRPVDPYVGSIAELMGQRGQIEADTAERIAAIRAQEATQRGQAWSGAIQGIGDLASKIPEQMQKAKEQEFQDSQRKRLLEEQGRVDAARSLYGDIQTTPNVEGMEMVSRPGERIETTLPSTFGYPDARGGITPVDIPAETQQTLSSRQGIPTLTNPYRDISQSGVSGINKWDLVAADRAFAEAGLGEEGRKYLGWMDDSNQWMQAQHDEKLAEVGRRARNIIELGEYPQMLDATEQMLEKFEDNGIFSARDLAEFRGEIDRVGMLPPDQQTLGMKKLLASHIPPSDREETQIYRPGEIGIDPVTDEVVGQGTTPSTGLSTSSQHQYDIRIPDGEGGSSLFSNQTGQYVPGKGTFGSVYWTNPANGETIDVTPYATQVSMPSRDVERLTMVDPATSEGRDVIRGSQLHNRLLSLAWAEGPTLGALESYQSMLKTEEASRVNANSFAMDMMGVIDSLISESPDQPGSYVPNSELARVFGATSYGNFAIVRGTDAATAQRQLARLVSNEIIQKIDEMKSQSQTGATGFGQLNEAELQILINASSILSDPGIGDKVAMRTIVKLRNTFAKIYNQTRGSIPTDEDGITITSGVFSGPISFSVD